MPTGRWIGDAHPEVDAPREGRWIARPKKARSVLQVGTAVWALGQFPNLLHLILKPWLGEGIAWIGAVAIPLLLFAATGLFAWRGRRARRMEAANQALMDASFGEQFALEITIVAAGKRLGSDLGVAWFTDGLMGFSGKASSFVLAAWDVEVARKAIPARSGKAAIPAGALVLVNAPFPGYVTATPLSGQLQAFRERFKQFEKETAARDAERFWPPLVPYDESPAVERGDSTGVIRG